MTDSAPLKLKLPERTPAPAKSFLLDIKEVESWVSSLPLANTGESSKRVFHTLVELNRIELPSLKRIKIISTLRPIVQYVASNLRKYYMDSPIPLTAKNQKIVVLCRELHYELANSYKIIIQTMAFGQTKRSDKQLIIIALHQAIFYLSKVLYYSAIAYNPYPVDVWHEIHQLFAFAERNKVARIKIKEGSENYKTTTTIEDIYKNAILLDLASPYRLHQQEIEHLYQRLPDWTRHIRIVSPQSHADHEGHFFIRTDSDEPATHISLQTKPLDNHCKIIDTRHLTQYLREELKALFSEKSKNALFTKEMQVTAPMLRNVIKSLTYAPKRGFIRTKLNFELEIAVGINAIHSQISTHTDKQQDSELEIGEATILNDDELKDSSFLDSFFAGDTDSLQIVPLDYPVEESAFKSKDTWITDDDIPAWATQTQEPESSTFSCNTFNESAGGYCINWTGNTVPNIQVGELIGIQSASDLSQFSISIARWLKHMPGVGLQLGMEIISPASIATEVNLQGDAIHNSTHHKCILLPGVTASSRPPCLLLPILNIHVGDIIQIDDNGQRRPVKLIRLLESTGTFSQFEFAYLDDTN